MNLAGSNFSSGSWGYVVAGGGGGGLTSVGLAFSGGAIDVTNSPLIADGTLDAVFQGSSDEYVDGTGNLQPFPAVPLLVDSADEEALTTSVEPLLTYTNPDPVNSHTYRIGAYVNLLMINVLPAIQVNVVWTDENNNGQTLQMILLSGGTLPTTDASAMGFFCYVPVDIRVGPSETITVNIQSNDPSTYDVGSTILFLD
jgi:hypothetical protein